MSDGSLVLPWLPPATIVPVPGRGEFFVRRHVHPDPDRPTLLLLHGWTASADLQFFTAYEALADEFSFVGIDHRGHGRGLRGDAPFSLEDAADDAAAVAGELGLEHVITIGYSMGGPISMLLARRHPDLVAGLVVQATALEWSGTRRERLLWRTLPLMGAALRSSAYPKVVRRWLGRTFDESDELAALVPWLRAELRRGDAHAIVEAGRALRHYDARPWAASIARPAAMLITTSDRLVKPRKQRALATALGAEVSEIDADHLCTLEQPGAYAEATVALVRSVVERAGVR